MRRLMMLATVVLVLVAAMVVMLAGTASAQGGCQAFGFTVAEYAKAFQPLGKNFVRGEAPVADFAHSQQALFCGS